MCMRNVHTYARMCSVRSVPYAVRVLNPYYALYIGHSALCYMLRIILYWFKLLLLIDVHVEFYKSASVNWKMQHMWCENQGENSRYSDHIFVSLAFFSQKWSNKTKPICWRWNFSKKKRKRLQIDLSALNIAKDVIFEHELYNGDSKSIFEPFFFSFFRIYLLFDIFSDRNDYNR